MAALELTQDRDMFGAGLYIHALSFPVGVEHENGVAEDLNEKIFRLSLSTIVALNNPAFPVR